MGANVTTIAYLRVLIIEIRSTIILKVVEAQGYSTGKLVVYLSNRKNTVFSILLVV